MLVETFKVRRQCRRWAAAVAAAAALLLPSGWAAGPLVVEMSLADLAGRAGAILHGRCIAVREAPDARPVPYVEYTFEVLGAVKGCDDASGRRLERITFRQAGARAPRRRLDGLEETRSTWGAPIYAAGDERVIFLTRESRLGLRAPVGLAQGSLPVERADGKAVVRNARGARLFEGMEPAAMADLGRDEAAMIASGAERLDLACFLGLCSKASR